MQEIKDMSSMIISLVVLVCICMSAFACMFIRDMLPEHHLSNDSKEVVKLSMGLIATMAALVLGLLTSSAKSAFDLTNSEIQQGAANSIQLDRALAYYGPETKLIRQQFRQLITDRLRATWPENDAPPMKMDTSERRQAVESLWGNIRKLSPQTDDQREFKVQAQQIGRDLMAMRWLVFAQAGSALPMPFLIVLVFWLFILFGGFGILAPRNATVIFSILLCALAVSGSIFLILEMDHPFDGLIKASGVPLQYALTQVGQ
jgi:hypothetical protein